MITLYLQLGRHGFFCWLILFFSIMPFTSLAADTKPKAADLVEDGQTIDLSSDRYIKLFDELRTKHKFTQEYLSRVFADVTIRKRVLELMDTQWEAKPYYIYYPNFIDKKMIEAGKQKLVEHKNLLDKIEKDIGVEREVLVAIWGIESRFGEHKGAFGVFQTLNTMFDAYPRRSTFYREQLIHFLLLCRENNVDPLTIMGSYGGAFGQPQFIPSSFRAYSVDFNNDGRRDVWESIPDILASIANYLRKFHWSFGAPIYWELGNKLNNDVLVTAFKKGRKKTVPWDLAKKYQDSKMEASPENREITIVGLEIDPEKGGGMRYVAGYPNFQAITKWNNSNRYAMAVTELAEKLKP